MDHNNLFGSALCLALLRPHLYMNNPVPLRLFGYPAPVQLLAVDAHPHSGGGPDNNRTNLVEALCAHLLMLDGDIVAQAALVALQDAWHMMRLRIDLALRQHMVDGPANAHAVVGLALRVQEDTTMQG